MVVALSIYMINVLDFAANGDMPSKVVLEICEDYGVFLVFSTLTHPLIQDREETNVWLQFLAFL